jgi:hypothetical protein
MHCLEIELEKLPYNGIGKNNVDGRRIKFFFFIVGCGS